MKPIGVSIQGLTHQFGSVTALDDVSCEIRPGVITGLIGRNGAGKTTLASLISGFRKPQNGSILVDGALPWENDAVTTRICFMRDQGGLIDDESWKNSLRALRTLRPNWDQPYFESLMDMFGIRMKKSPAKLSRGQRSALAASVALATRCELTIIDEIHLGMDAVARRNFYEALLADYVANPRTFVISSHLLDEIEDQLEDVIILHDGKVVEAGVSDDVRAHYSTDAKVASLTDILVRISGGQK